MSEPKKIIRRIVVPARPKPLSRPSTTPPVVKEGGQESVNGHAAAGAGKREVTYIGIDPSLTSFGLAVLTADDRYRLYSYHSPIKVTKDHRGAVDRLLDIKKWLGGVLLDVTFTCGPVHMVCMENYSYGAANQLPAMGELGGIVKTTLLDHHGRKGAYNGYPTLVAPNQLKKYATGDGGAGTKKEHILKAVYKTWGIDIASNDMADAYVLAEMARSLDLGRAKYAYQQEVVDRLVPCTEAPPEVQWEHASP